MQSKDVEPIRNEQQWEQRTRHPQQLSKDQRRGVFDATNNLVQELMPDLPRDTTLRATGVLYREGMQIITRGAADQDRVDKAAAELKQVLARGVGKLVVILRRENR